jgi:hypothetical protein
VEHGPKLGRVWEWNEQHTASTPSLSIPMALFMQEEEFTTANGVTVNRIAKWNTDSVGSEFGTGMNSAVIALAFDSSGNLHAGGSFATAGGIDALRTAKWNGSSWEKFIDVDSTVNALLITEPT